MSRQLKLTKVSEVTLLTSLHYIPLCNDSGVLLNGFTSSSKLVFQPIRGQDWSSATIKGCCESSVRHLKLFPSYNGEGFFIQLYNCKSSKMWWHTVKKQMKTKIKLNMSITVVKRYPHVCAFIINESKNVANQQSTTRGGTLITKPKPIFITAHNHKTEFASEGFTRDCFLYLDPQSRSEPNAQRMTTFHFKLEI